jgi:N-acetylglucosamine-6-phosphate deacetylase
MQNPITLFYNGRVLRNHQLKKENLWIQGDKIVAPKKHVDQKIDCEGKIIAPGYIDLQINGSCGVDFSSEPERWQEAAKKLASCGVTGFLAAIVSQTPSHYKQLLAKLQPEKSEGAALLGIHLEGPFLNPNFAGAHDVKNIVNELTFQDLASVKMVTLAPELPGSLPIIAQLEKRGIRTAAGHSNASYEEFDQAVKSGLSIATHLFNAMRPFHHRDPGMIGYTLTHPQISYSLILDGVHLHPETAHLAWKANPSGLFLVTDAMEGALLDEGDYHLGEKKVQVRGNRAFLEDGKTLAGSVLTMDQAVRNCIAFTGCSEVEALEAASLKPAKLLRLQQKGHLDVGADADLILLDDQLHITTCYVNGIQVYSKQ